MPLSAGNFVANTGKVAAQDMLNFFNLFTGVMADQPVTFANNLAVGGVITGKGAVPPGGAAGQVLGKNSGTDYDLLWTAAESGLPAGGTTGQVLTKNSNTSGDAGWATPFTQAAADARYLTPAQAAATYLPLAGGTMTGLLVLSADPSANLGAATKQYVDGQVATRLTQAQGDARYLQLAGGTLTGPLILAADPTVALGAATKQYADTKMTQTQADARYLPLTGGTLSGPGTLTVQNTLTTVGPLLFNPDNQTDIGANGATRPRNVWVGTTLYMPSSGGIVWNNDQGHRIVDFPASNYMELREWMSEMRFTRADTGAYFRLRGLPTATAMWTMENANGDVYTSSATTWGIGANAYYDGSAWQRWNTSVASGLFNSSQGAYSWYSAAAGTGAISGWGTAKMALDPNGALTIQSGLILNRTANVQWGGSPGATQDRISLWSDGNIYIDLNTAGAAVNIRAAGSGSTTVALNVQNGWVQAGASIGTLTVGDLSANRGGGTGVLYLGSTSTYLYYDGGSYNLPGHNLNVGSGVVAQGSTFYFGSTSGSYFVDSGGTTYYRSGASSHNFQSTGGSAATVNTGALNVNGNLGVSNGTVFIGNWGYFLGLGSSQVFDSGGTIYLRAASNDLIVQNTGGGYTRVLCGPICLQSGTAQGVASIVNDGTNNVYKGVTGTGNHIFQHADGTWEGTMAANFQQQSALKYKTDIRPMADRALALICEPALRGISYTLKHTGDRRLGFAADVWEPFLPEAVSRNPETGEVETMEYSMVIPILWEVVRRLAQESGLCR